jgi:hypothetical protein
MNLRRVLPEKGSPLLFHIRRIKRPSQRRGPFLFWHLTTQTDSGICMKTIKLPAAVDLGGYDIAYLEVGQYNTGGSMAIQAFCSDGEPACTLSVNVPQWNDVLGKDEFFLKNYSENETPVAKLIEAGYIEIIAEKPPIKNGFVEIPIARLKLTT